MAGLDLSGVQRVMDRWLADADVVVARDFGTADATMGEDGKLTEPGPYAVYVGNGVVQSLSGFTDVPEIQRIVEETDARWRLLLPLAEGATQEPQAGDEVWVTEVRAKVTDERLVDVVWQIVDVGGASVWSVMRVYYLKLDRRVSATPTTPDPLPDVPEVP